jgi:hypothetical protein
MYGSVAELIAGQPGFNHEIQGGRTKFRQPIVPGEQRLIPSMQEKLPPALPPVRKAADDFLEDYLDTRAGGEDTLIAADVLTPDLNSDGSFKLIKGYQPGEMRPKLGNITVDYPQLPDRREPYRALGVFGSKSSPANPVGDLPAGYTINRGRLRGYMEFVPGGVPAAPGFNYDAYLKEYPEQMRGIKRGYMPVYATDYPSPQASPAVRPSISPSVSRPVSTAPVVRSSPGDDDVVNRILNSPLPRPRPSTPSNPFAGESQEYQDMMRRLGVIQ